MYIYSNFFIIYSNLEDKNSAPYDSKTEMETHLQYGGNVLRISCAI